MPPFRYDVIQLADNFTTRDITPMLAVVTLSCYHLQNRVSHSRCHILWTVYTYGKPNCHLPPLFQINVT